MKRFLVVVVSMIVAACGKGSSSDGKAGDECTAAIAHMTSLQRTNLPKDLSAAEQQKVKVVIAKTSGAIEASCRDTQWPKEAIACLKGLKSMEDEKQCYDKLTQEQHTAVQTAAQRALAEALQPSD